MYRVLKRGLKVLYTPALRVRHEPDLTVRTVAETVLAYDAGAAAWHAKHVAHGDWFMLKLFFLRLRRAAAIRACAMGLIHGDIDVLAFRLKRILILLWAFVSRLRDEWQNRRVPGGQAG
jgi:hypothetical protein